MKTTSTTLGLLIPLSLGMAHAATITSIASGEWDVAATWSDNTAAPTTGTQGTGNDYIIASTFTVTSNDTGNNTQALIGSSITVQSGGVLDLARLHAFGLQTVTLNLPRLTLQDGSELQFRSSTGSNAFNLASAIQTSGNVIIDNTGGGYAADINLSGPFSGSGQVTYTTANSASTTTTRTLALKSANSTFSGNWIVRHANTGNDFGALRADAANALGSGSVTLENRAHLTNNATGGLDSLTGISLTGANTLAYLGSGWNSPTGSLTLSNGAVAQGSLLTPATSTFQSLNQSGGTLQFDVGIRENQADLLDVDTYTHTGGSIQVSPMSLPGSNSFPLVQYGSLIGTPTVTIAPNYRLTPVVDLGLGTDSAVSVSFTGNNASLTWKGNHGTSPKLWDLNTTNNFDDGVNQTFYQLDEVVFDDTATTYAVEMSGTLIPSNLLFTASSDYSLAPATGVTGILSGGASITKLGSGNLTLGGSNGQNYTGPVLVQGGTLKLASRDALGLTSGVTVSTGASVDLNGQTPGTVNTGGYSYSLAGNGPDGNGALVHSGTTSIASNAGVKYLTLLADATIGAIGSTATRFDVGSANTAGVGNLDTAGFTLTQKGPGSIYYRGPATNFKLDVLSGRAGAEGTSTDVFGGENGSVTIRDGAQAYLVTAGTYANAFNLTGLGWTETPAGTLGALHLGNNTVVSGPVSISGTTRITAYNAAATISGNIVGDATSVLQLGGSGLNARSGDITLSGDNSYGGGTEIRGGVMTATSSNAFGSGPILIDEGNAVGYITRLQLQGVTIDNDITSASNAQTGFQGTIVATGGSLSTVNGTVTVTSAVGNGGHLGSSGTGSILRVNGPILSEITVNARFGTVELGGGGTYPELYLGQDTLRLSADNGVNPNAKLNLAVSAPGIFDLNGFDQSLVQLTRHSTSTANVTNTGSSESTLTLNGTNNFTYSGTMTNGTGGIAMTKAGTSTMTLTGEAAISGPINIQEGKLIANSTLGTAGSSPLIVDAQGSLGGSGPILGTVTVYGSLTPATTTGTLAAGDSLTFGPNSSLVTDLTDTAGTPGTGWDLVTAKSLAFAAAPGQPVEVVVPALPTGFTNSNLTFEIVRTTDGISGFDPSSVLVDASALSTTGTWSLSVTGNSLYLNYSPGSGSPFESWADANDISGATPEQDNDLDGIKNAIEFVIGGDPNTSSLHLLPTATRTGDALIFTFRRATAAAGENIVVEYSTDLSNWTQAEAGENGVTYNETAEGFGENVDRVDVSLPLSLANSKGQLFARLKVTID